MQENGRGDPPDRSGGSAAEAAGPDLPDSAVATTATAGATPQGPSIRALTWLLAWAVVFCDIGTSVYYVPGILYHQVGNLAPFFVGLVVIGFVLLSQKYTEITWRNPEGGGVVTVARKAFGPWWGGLGGILITIDYFLTSSISSVSGFEYLSSIFPPIEPYIVVAACCGLALLCVLNIIGIRESALVALWMAVASLVTNMAVVSYCLVHLTREEIRLLLDSAREFSVLPTRTLIVGFAGSWLAFSGLEAISQLSPTLRMPIKKTASRAMLAVVGTILITSPILTALAVAVLPAATKAAGTETFISDLALVRAGPWLQVAVVLSASALLLFAANTAMIGGYHVFLALARERFFPRILARRSRIFSTPHWAIAITTVVPVAVIIATQGHLNTLGDMYSFGLLGAFTFESLGLDVMRWRARARGPLFVLGVLTTAVVAFSWGVNIIEKPLATIFGGGLTLFGMFVALGVRREWFIHAVNRIPFVSRRAARIRRRLEFEVEEEQEIVTLAGAVAMRPLYKSTTLVAVLGRNPKLMAEAIRRCKGRGEAALYLMSVTEWPGLFSGAENRPSSTTVEALSDMGKWAGEEGILAIPVWAVSDSAPRSLAEAAQQLGCDAVMLGVTQRSAIYHMLRGNVLRGLTRYLPEGFTIITVG